MYFIDGIFYRKPNTQININRFGRFNRSNGSNNNDEFNKKLFYIK